MNNILLSKNYIGMAISSFKLGSIVGRLMQLIGFFFTTLFVMSQPLKADLNASYSLGDMLFAAYEIPRSVSAANIRLATELEYSDFGGALPEFYDSIVVADRSAAVGELFVSTNAPLYDEAFDLIFVNAASGDVLDWFSLSLANGAVRVRIIQSSTIENVNSVVTAPHAPKSYNDGNREVVALLMEVSRQLSESSEKGGNDAPMRAIVSDDKTNITPSVPERNPIIEPDLKLPVPLHDGPQPLSYTGATEVVSEVRLAAASMKNFVLTIIVVALALALATYLILSKTREYASEQIAHSSTTPNAAHTSAENVTASASFLTYIKEENKRSQEILLRSLELISASQKFENLSDGLSTQGSSVAQPPTPGQAEAPQISRQADGLVPTKAKPAEPVQASRPTIVAASAQKNRHVPDGGNRAQGEQKNKTVMPNVPPAEITAKFKEKIEIAEVYKNMGDIFVAQNLLQEVIQSGNPAEIAKAKKALDELGDSQ